MNEKRHEVGDAHAEVDEAARSRLDDLGDLLAVAQGRALREERLAELDLAQAGEADADEGWSIAQEAEDRLSEFPLAVESTRVFEVVLGTGGPDDRLLIECDMDEYDIGGGHRSDPQYEVRRVLYRYSWTGSAERELTGKDREVALEFARRVVPELAE